MPINAIFMEFHSPLRQGHAFNYAAGSYPGRKAAQE